MEVILSVGAKKHTVEIPDEGTVSDLMILVESKTKISEEKQKLIFKGVTISKDPGKKLSECGIKSGSKIMVIGKRYDPEEEVSLKKLNSVEKEITNVDKSILDLETQVDGILKGFVSKEHMADAYKSVKKQLLTLSHSLMKHLENVDAMILPLEFKDARIRRKVVVEKIHKQMDRCDSTLELIEND